MKQLHLIAIVGTIITNILILPMEERPMAASKDATNKEQANPGIKKIKASTLEGISLFLCGDVMTGRGIDQILPHPGSPVIHESYLRSALGYVELAENVNGPIPRPVSYDYIWGDALSTLDQFSPDLRIINLETSVTTSDDFWPKGINYRMHPYNISCLVAADIDCSILANNHILDWQHSGLIETLDVLEKAGIQHVGAGKNTNQARTPAIFDIPGKGRLVIFAYASKNSGVPGNWKASRHSPGINVLPDLSSDTVNRIAEEVTAIKQPNDVVLFSLHWGGNWGYDISPEEQQFAHALIDKAGIDAIYGHSSHHVKGVEVYQGKLILYGCGDFLNDYEGIQGYERYRSELTLMYFPRFDPRSGKLMELRMVPMQIKRFQTITTTASDTQWLMNLLNREGRKLGTRVELHADGFLELAWE